MAFFDYAKVSAMAQRLLNRFGHGNRITIERSVGGEYDPVTGETSPANTVRYLVSGVVENYDVKEVDGTRIQADDRKLIIDGTVEPLMTDRIIVDGEVLGVIVNIAPTDPAGKAVIYTLQIRK
jgi:hypothetical protein